MNHLLIIANGGIYQAEAQQSELKWILKRNNSTSEKASI